MDLTRAGWRKSSYSGTNGGECVEVATVRQAPGHLIAVRDSKNPGGPVLALAAEQWRVFTGQVKGGTFDLG